jgi:hypothetical protein
MRRSVLAALLAALLIGSFGAATAWLWIEYQPRRASQTSPPGPPPGNSVKTIALEWFEHLQVGQIDRTQMTTEFSENLTDDAVQEMSRFLASYGPPTGDEIVQRQDRGSDILRGEILPAAGRRSEHDHRLRRER